MKILIVDDNPNDRTILQYMVRKRGHEAVEAEDGSAGLRVARAAVPDLIISDALMPVMDGYQFLREVRQDPALRSVPFIFYSSSYKEEQDVRLAMSLGADAYFTKPVEPIELWGKIEDLLKAEKRAPASPVRLVQEDAEYLRQYSQVVATKLEEKVRELEQTLEERKRAEEALKKSEAFVKNILESVDEGFIVVDRDYRIVSANRAFCRFAHADEATVVGRFCYEVSHHVKKPCFENGEECVVKRTFETGTATSAMHMHTHAEREKQYVEIKSYPIADESGTVVSAIETISDVTEKKKLEEQLRQSQKMEAVGTLAGGVAHDFNNILMAIIGYGNIAKMKMRPDDPQLASIDAILASADRAAHLTKGLLAFSRRQVINPKPVDVNDIVKRVEALLRRLIGEDVELAMQPAERGLIVMADAGQIEQVLMNLATNARDAMPDGGMLTIATQELDLQEDFISAHGFGRPGKYVLISVSDTGAGMDERTREKIFEPFFTTKEVGKGTGLGLSIVYGIVKQHDGVINVYSEQGKGTTFKIYLPLIAEAAERPFAETTAPPRKGTETILLAEDDRDVRNLTGTILRDFGYRVIEAVDGQDAVDKFAEHAKEIDLLLLDVIMPRKSGKDVYEAVKAVRPDAKVLFISGYAADIIRRKGVFEEGVHFVSKPVSPFELLRKLREILDQNLHRSGTL